MTGHHYAPAAVRDSIRRHGIDFRRGRSGSDLPPGHPDRYPDGNYVFLGDPDPSSLWAQLGHDCWQVNLDGLALTDDPHASVSRVYASARYCLSPLASERIHLLEAAFAA
jgi:hypothetical protein